MKNFSLTYAPGTALQRLALQDINLSVAKGEYRALIGPQGSGKSTLLQVMAGLLTGEGQVTVAGLDLRPAKNRDQLWRQVGLVFQYPERQLFEDTVFNDVAYGPRNLGLNEAEVQRRVRAALAAVNLPPETHRLSPFKLSGGQQRRAAIACVLAMEPRLLLLDEPTAGLDPRAKGQLMDLFSRLCREKQVTVVLVTHDMEEVAHRADKVTVLSQGRVVLEGCPRQVFACRSRLAEIGLALPFAAQLAGALQEKGLPVRQMTTMAEAERQVAELLHRCSKIKRAGG
ncbi:Energy-coupling factor transporter ATP-binding protein EcfA 1 [Desulforamulus hydrothermalis Lam5 = DSM 18033]|uniref:Energy-coupling factor transporter ATP-binding protein EcfA 1 n=1 Tax=Desulforamulus hydrothermalis Lam5 = DSM 18033 TaxID=1121428 RepID=K8E8I6_9FIRM|nr:Energy-coupling factor transporter ATP-binding protein EcfA 1 [Desulforamulus hydrothermalis Lam5 = DSM 18033]SHH27159.1 energy-coupling factor transport system ATP-binding protein [Desulforamulus hydrothermalis Lam5 = DSM 18033]